MADKLIPILAVVGPTASGKTGLGVELAVRLGGEVVSCDSMQIYRGMDIATAKPTVDEMRGVAHHLIDFVDRHENYSVARYVRDANAAIRDVASRGRLPILVGGTGLYYSSLIDNISFDEQPTDEDMRHRLTDEAGKVGGEKMLERLRIIDPEYAERLHPADVKRIVRALEIYYTTGTTMSEQLKRSRLQSGDILPLSVGINFADRERLYERINLRVDQMLKRGLLDEAASTPSCGTAAQAIGHKELAPYLDGRCTLDEAVESLKRETRRYAKRQLTWFRRDGRIYWLEADGRTTSQLADEAVKLIDSRFMQTASAAGINIHLEEQRNG